MRSGSPLPKPALSEAEGLGEGSGVRARLGYFTNWPMASKALITVPMRASEPISQRVCTSIRSYI